MNVIFLDFDGVLNTIHHNSNEDIEKKIAILADICKEYNCKIVIEAAAKNAIDEETLQSEVEWVNFILNLFKKYNIKCIGRTPNIKKIYNHCSYIPMWKEDEIRLYLFRHPEIEHFCIIDDDDLAPKNSDLNKVRDYLVKTVYYNKNPNREGLLLEHKEKIGEVLKKENKIRNLVLKKQNKKK